MKTTEVMEASNIIKKTGCGTGLEIRAEGRVRPGETFRIRAAMTCAVLVTVCMMLTGMLNGCSSGGCTENQSAVPLAEFCRYADGSRISLDSIEIRGEGAPGDTVLLKSSPVGASQVYLPMRPLAREVTWEISYKKKVFAEQGLTDRLTLTYESMPYFASEECGAFYEYHITGVSHTETLIDSVGLVDALVTNIDKVYLKIYFRASVEDEPQESEQKGGRS